MMINELCYANNQKSLFRKYAKLVTWYGRQFNKDIALYLPNGFIEGEGKDYRLTVYPRPINAPVLYPALMAIDALQYRLESFKTAQDILWWYLAGGRVPTLLRQVNFSSVLINPDANPESTSVDGVVYRNNGSSEAFATIRTSGGTGAGDTDVSAEAIALTSSSANPDFRYLNRAVYLFDTSALTSSAEISAAVLSLYGTSVRAGVGSTNFEIATCSPSSNTGLIASDYNIAGWGSTKLATGISTGSWNSAGYNDFTLNASGLAAVSKTGITKLGGRTTWDIDNNTTGYTWVSLDNTRFNTNFSDNGSNKPRLVLTYQRVTGGYFYMSV